MDAKTTRTPTGSLQQHSGDTLRPRVCHSCGDTLTLSSCTPSGSRTPRGCRSSGNTCTPSGSRTPGGCRGSGNTCKPSDSRTPRGSRSSRDTGTPRGSRTSGDTCTPRGSRTSGDTRKLRALRVPKSEAEKAAMQKRAEGRALVPIKFRDSFKRFFFTPTGMMKVIRLGLLIGALVSFIIAKAHEPYIAITVLEICIVLFFILIYMLTLHHLLINLDWSLLDLVNSFITAVFLLIVAILAMQEVERRHLFYVGGIQCLTAAIMCILDAIVVTKKMRDKMRRLLGLEYESSSSLLLEPKKTPEPGPTPTPGKAGTPAAEQAPTPAAGKAGTPAAGKAGTPAAGKAGTPAAGKAAPAAAPAKAPAKTPAKAPARAAGKAPTPAAGKAPTPAAGKAPTPAPAADSRRASTQASSKASSKPSTMPSSRASSLPPSRT
ncbi:CKLF-like MARVEL transmembrane domain-containing protein 1 [Neovison vison]|uniref:CKLF-like MARVEL transmembrane domain-containing protein 1 n=1 Tax=Neovison vison TaxID=452646 RepID=UPI001CF06FC7|nr:CKLF-like MARVEL transmembrane domain-containing protein 1 [Neogale vison]